MWGAEDMTEAELAEIQARLDRRDLQSLQDLDGEDWGDPDDPHDAPTSLIERCLRLRRWLGIGREWIWRSALPVTML